MASISQSFIFFVALSCVSCVQKGNASQNYTIVKTEAEEVQRVAGELLAESNRLLDEEFSGDSTQRMAWEKARERRGFENVLFLPHLEKLNLIQAQAIAENSSRMYLNGLKTLSPEIAKNIFSNGYAYAEFNGLEEISPESALYMRDSFDNSRLMLNGLKEIPSEVVKVLMSKERSGEIYLGGVTSISDEVVRTISRVQPDVRKQSVSFRIPNLNLTPELARNLPKATFSSVIEKEEILSDEIVEMISQSDLQYIYLDQIKEIQPKHLSSILRKERTSISLDGLMTLKRGIAQELVRVSPESLSVNGLRSISSEDIDILVHSDIKTLYVQGLNPKEYKKLAKAFRKSDRDIIFKSE